jgi:hypothetical protein
MKENVFNLSYFLLMKHLYLQSWFNSKRNTCLIASIFLNNYKLFQMSSTFSFPFPRCRMIRVMLLGKYFFYYWINSVDTDDLHYVAFLSFDQIFKYITIYFEKSKWKNTNVYVKEKNKYMSTKYTFISWHLF